DPDGGAQRPPGQLLARSASSSYTVLGTSIGSVAARRSDAMRRTTPLLPLCVLAMAMFATLAQEPPGQGGGSASPAPVAPADQAPPAPEAPAPAASTPPAENQKLTGTVIATPANAIVIRNEGGVDITFLVESTSVLPRSMSVGEMATVVYRGTEGGQPVALMITLFPAPQQIG